MEVIYFDIFYISFLSVLACSLVVYYFGQVVDSNSKREPYMLDSGFMPPDVQLE